MQSHQPLLSFAAKQRQLVESNGVECLAKLYLIVNGFLGFFKTSRWTKAFFFFCITYITVLSSLKGGNKIFYISRQKSTSTWTSIRTSTSITLRLNELIDFTAIQLSEVCAIIAQSCPFIRKHFLKSICSWKLSLNSLVLVIL